MEKVTITLDEANSERALAFFNVYELESILDTSQLKRELMLGDNITRKCRFCGKMKPETTFRKKAHIIPQFLGNKVLLSAFECDVCNHEFGQLYEDSFANYIGAYRPFSGVSGAKSNRSPKHKEPKKIDGIDVTRLMIKAANQAVQVYHEAPFDDSIEIDDDKKRLTIHAKRNPYTPIYVYKALLKIALSMIQEDEIENLSECIKFLMDNSQKALEKDNPLYHVHIHQVYGPRIFLKPTAYLYTRKNDPPNNMIPARTFILYSGNHIYQIFLPFNKEDEYLVGQQARMHSYPLLFDQSIYELGVTYSSYWEMLSGQERVYGENQKLMFSFEKIIYGNTKDSTKNEQI